MHFSRETIMSSTSSYLCSGNHPNGKSYGSSCTHSSSESSYSHPYEAEALAQLNSTDQDLGGEPMDRLQAQSKALFGAFEVYTCLKEQDSECLSDRQKAIIRRYEEIKDEITNALEGMGSAAELLYQPLYSELLLIPRENLTDSMREFMRLFLEVMKSSRELATTLSVTHFMTQIESLKKMATHILEEGKHLTSAAKIQGALSIAAGSAQAVFALKAVKPQIQASKLSSKAEGLSTLSKSADSRSACLSFGKRAAQASEAAANANADATKRITWGQFSSTATNSFAQLGSAEENLKAKYEESDRAKEQVNVTSAEKMTQSFEEKMKSEATSTNEMIQSISASTRAHDGELDIAARG
jgi:hypothetical protein